ncbi:hypothetical protein, partial [Vibrio parahaemolyticus]|uniref:hypothetical protein n=1 Tax=Vibrio parahaemolyticus TaxID=670 RepID=UPI001C5FF9FF
LRLGGCVVHPLMRRYVSCWLSAILIKVDFFAGSAMDDKQLDRSLRSIGKECFVKYYELFQDPNWSKEDLIEHLIALEGYQESGCITRISQSRRIFNDHREYDALDMVISSNRVPIDIIEKARKLRLQ